MFKILTPTLGANRVKRINRLSKMEQGLGFSGRVKYVEEIGSTLEDIITTKDPWGKDPCGRKWCFSCQTDPGKCTRQGIVYHIDCLICSQEGLRTQYVGESARTAFDRGAEHLGALKRMDQKHPMVEHHLEEHRGQQVSCRFKVIKYHDRPLQRQAHEGFLIANFKGHKILNGRGDWGQNLPPRIMMEQDFYESKRQAEAQSVETGVKRQRLEAVINQVAPIEATMPHLEPLEPPGRRSANNQGVHPEASGPPLENRGT